MDIDQRVTWDETRELLFENYRFKGNRTDRVPRVARLTEYFGKLLGEEITTERIKEYSRKRLYTDGAAAATLRRELAILKRMLRLASGRLSRVPLVDMPRVHNARQGFFEEDALRAILPHLPEHARFLVEFLYLTGWRSGEAFGLRWSEVDWNRRTVFLSDSKNREPRIFPFKFHPRVEIVLLRQRDLVTRWERAHARVCPWVFHWRGRRIAKLRRSWQRACRLAGMQGRLIDRSRATAVKDLLELVRRDVAELLQRPLLYHATQVRRPRYPSTARVSEPRAGRSRAWPRTGRWPER